MSRAWLLLLAAPVAAPAMIERLPVPVASSSAGERTRDPWPAVQDPVSPTTAPRAPGPPSAVQVYDCLPAPASLRARQSIAARQPQQPVAWTTLAEPDVLPTLRRTRDEERPALVLGADGFTLDEAAADGLLEACGSEATAEIVAAFRGPHDIYVAPLALPLVLAFDRQRWTRATAPAAVDDLLFTSPFDAQLVLCRPAAMPALWVGWLQQMQREGRSEEFAYAWFTTLDARAAAYVDAPAAVLAALRRGEGSLGLVHAMDLVHGADHDDGRFDWVVPHPGLPARWVGLALVRRPGNLAPARALHAHLASRDFAQAMVMGDALVASPRTDALVEPSRMLPVTPTFVGRDQLVQRWESTVVGRGRRFEWLDGLLDVVLASVFVAFMVIVYRQLRRTEPRAERS